MHFSPNNKNKKNYSGKESSIYKTFLSSENDDPKNIYKNNNLTGIFNKLPNENRKKDLSTKLLNFDDLNNKFKSYDRREKNNGTIIINNNIHINTFYDKRKSDSDNNIQTFFDYGGEGNKLKKKYKNFNSKDFKVKDGNVK